LQQLHEHIISTSRHLGKEVYVFNPVGSLSLSGIFEGQYLSTDPPEAVLCSREDFIRVRARDPTIFDTDVAMERVPLGDGRLPSELRADGDQRSPRNPPKRGRAPLQTKTETLQAQATMLELPVSGPNLARPYEVIIVASLIDNYFNIGGLSRVSEIFGVKSLQIDKLEVLKTQQFVSVAVSSDVWLPIEELPVAGLPQYLRDRKLEGHTVVGIEQTDRSKMLGQDEWRFPKKTILVLGSEREGIPAPLLSEMDVCVEIPQKGQTRSMNVQTAAAVVLYEYTRQHTPAC
jgi:tRNA guanosine-2'-O-methyltransferase